jgi:hypothetical protein
MSGLILKMRGRMSKLIDALANLPEAEVEELVGLYFGDQILEIASNDTPEKLEENKQKLNAIRSHALVAVLSDKKRQSINSLCNKAEAFISIDDNELDEE